MALSFVAVYIPGMYIPGVAALNDFRYFMREKVCDKLKLLYCK